MALHFKLHKSFSVSNEQTLAHTNCIMVAIAIASAISLGLLFLFLRSDPSNDNLNVPSSVVSTDTHKPMVSAVSSNMLFFGNAFWGRRTNTLAMASDLQYAYPFSGLAGFERDTYNAWIAGLECPMVADYTPSAYQEEKLLSFNCNPDYLPEAKKWFTVFTLANNHTDNQGVAGFTETQKHLDEHGIQYFGHYDPKNLDNVCDVIAMPATATLTDETTKTVNLPVALCGYHGFLELPPQESLAVMQQYSAYMPVIAMPHAGTEYKPAPNDIIAKLYRRMIDNGADMVLGDHPHWVQTTESYNGHLIVYSMGNFMFDQQGSQELTRSAGINVRMTTPNADQLQQWIDLAVTCKNYHDDCLAHAKAKNLSKLPYTFTFGVVGTDSSDRITKPASGSIQASIVDRMQWQQTMGQLHSPYNAL